MGRGKYQKRRLTQTRLREAEPDSVQEATALRDLHQQVSTAFEAKFNPPQGMGEVGEYWPIEVFSEFATCRKGGKTFRVAYKLQDGEVVFGSDELEEVEVEFMPVRETAEAFEEASVGTLKMEKEAADNFWAKCKKGTKANCWPWTGAKNDKGYGIVEVKGRTMRAIRVAYMISKGDIPSGKQVAHSDECTTTACINPAHLSTATNAENAAQRAKEAVSPVLTVTESYRTQDNGIEVVGSLCEAEDDAGWIWEVAIIKAGRTKEHRLPNGKAYVREYSQAVLTAAVPLFEGIGVFAFSGQEHAPSPGAKGVKDQIGYLENVRMVGSEMRGHLHLHGDATWLRDRLLALREAKKLKKTGLSMDAGGNGTWSKDGDLDVMAVTEITEASSVEIVHSPAAGGQVQRLVASTEGDTNMNLEQILALIESARPKLLEGKDREKITMEQAQEMLTEAMAEPKPKPAKVPDPPAAPPSADGDLKEAMAAMAVNQKKQDERMQAQDERMQAQDCKTVLEGKLTESKLPPRVIEKVRKQYAGQVFEAEALDATLTEEGEVVTALLGEAMPRSYGSVEVILEESDKRKHALEAAFWTGPQDQSHPNFPEHLKGVKPFTSISEAHEAISGKRLDARAMFAETSRAVFPVDGVVRLDESATVSTWEQLLGDSITRRMQAEYSLPDLQTWKKVVSNIASPKDFRTQRAMVMGGYGTLSEVSEQGTYPTLTTPGDTEETYAVSKKGGLDDFTWEMQLADDVGALRRIPVKLARAAAQTLHRTVFDLIEDNDQLADGTALVATSVHANLITGGALSNTTLTEARLMMMNQTAYGDSSEVLGSANVPKYIIHPNELDEMVFQLTARWDRGQGEHDTGNRNVNFHGYQGIEGINIAYFAVATDYWVMADPANIPTIEVGFLRGQQEPELFVQDDPKTGSVFTADKITFKVRHVHNAIALNYRGFAGYIV